MSESCSSSPTEFRSLTRRVVESFLQTVVVLDDFAEMPGAREEPTERAVSDRFTSPEFPQAPAPVDDEVNRAPQGVPLNAKSVIDGFAEIGAVCAVLKANPDDNSRERTIRTARRADIVILDWTIYDSTGEKALSVMHNILEEDSSSRRLRLIAVYTGERDLRSIYDRVRDEVDKFYEDENLREEVDGLRITKGPLNIVVLAKAGVLGPHSELTHQEVNEEELANRLIDEFANMTGGLIRNVAIAGIAGIRDNAHRILAEFDPSRDPAYLGHRLLLPHPSDAENHLDEMLSSEISSVLEENLPGTHADIETIESWLLHRESEGLNLSDPFEPLGDRHLVGNWCLYLDQGYEILGLPKKKDTGKQIGKGTLYKKSTEPFADDADSASQSNRHFAALLMLKNRYPSRPPRLSTGIIIRTCEAERQFYFLCLQPKCDSVRLSDATGFPFIPLIPLTGAGEASAGINLRLVVENREDGEWKYFGIDPKPSELFVYFFQPEVNPPGEVAAQKCSDGQFYFKDTCNRKYCWIAQMKDEHALRVAGEIAASLARPGPNDSEWLRMAKGKPIR